MADFLMPQLGADMSTGKLLAWRRKPGERIERGEIIADIETDKADIEVESFVSGVVERILVEPGERVAVGAVLAVIREDGPTRDQVTPVSAQTAVEPPVTGPLEPRIVAARSESPPAEHIRISPAARKLAEELGVDPSAVSGTGPGGRITREDVERAGQIKAPATDAAGKAARMREAIAAAMARSKREIPHYYLSTCVDVTRALAWLADENLKRPVAERLLPGLLYVKAVALALVETPELNGFWKDGRAETSSAIHVGIAISLRQGGLIAPALHDVDRKSLGELMAGFRDLVNRARSGSLRSSEYLDPTITVTSLGDHGVEAVFGVIYPPQVALVGFGKVVERPWVVDGQVVVRSVVTVTLSADHRVSDGHRGARFLSAIDRCLQQPETL